MKFIKSYKLFLEDGTACVNASNTAGMGAVVASQPGLLPGTTGTTGSGDIPYYFLTKGKKKVKNGNPSQVSDLRFLEPAKGITKVKESYDNIDDYIFNIKSKLKFYNIRPVQLNRLMDFYNNKISEYYEEGKDTSFFINDIKNELELDNSGGFMSQKLGASNYNQTIKYL